MNTITSQNFRPEFGAVRPQKSPSTAPSADAGSPINTQDTAQIGLSGLVDQQAPGVSFLSQKLPGYRYTGFVGTTMAAPVISGLAAIALSTFSGKEEYIPRGIEHLDLVGAVVEEHEAVRRFSNRLKDEFGLSEILENVSVEKSTFPSTDMGLPEAGTGAFGMNVRARSVHLRNETHNFLLRESLDSDNSTVAIWNAGERMPDIWERDPEKNVLVAPGTAPVQASAPEERVGRLA
ncbi:MAG: hypothetical protein WC314_04605 [Vulcanimicrobiota bacterium]